MSKTVERVGTRIRIIDDETNRQLWNGRTDVNPPEYMCYSEQGVKKALRVDQSSDAQLLEALEHLLDPK
jgi:hypothetical protein